MTTHTFHGCDELREWLVSQGFTIFHDNIGNSGANWYACRKSDIPARECETNKNKRIQLVAKPFQAFDSLRSTMWQSVQVDVTGECGGVWYKLMAYSLYPDELREDLPEIERRLIAAWNAL